MKDTAKAATKPDTIQSMGVIIGTLLMRTMAPITQEVCDLDHQSSFLLRTRSPGLPFNLISNTKTFWIETQSLQIFRRTHFC